MQQVGWVHVFILSGTPKHETWHKQQKTNTASMKRKSFPCDQQKLQKNSEKTVQESCDKHLTQSFVTVFCKPLGGLLMYPELQLITTV
jgi:hypothetical protein